MTDIILSILTAVLGGTNIFQFFLWKSERKKANAEAGSAENDCKRGSFELNKDTADYLIESLDKVHRECVELQEQIRISEAKHTEAILDKCKLISELRSKVVYHKEFSCFRADCKQRQKQRTKDEEPKKESEVVK